VWVWGKGRSWGEGWAEGAGGRGRDCSLGWSGGGGGEQDRLPLTHGGWAHTHSVMMRFNLAGAKEGLFPCPSPPVHPHHPVAAPHLHSQGTSNSPEGGVGNVQPVVIPGGGGGGGAGGGRGGSGSKAGRRSWGWEAGTGPGGDMLEEASGKRGCARHCLHTTTTALPLLCLHSLITPILPPVHQQPSPPTPLPPTSCSQHILHPSLPPPHLPAPPGLTSCRRS
jgi:hypothetical protein